MRYLPHTPWLKALFPEGIDASESILISGPGGSGKPLVELAFVDSWLNNGGSVIGIPLQYSSFKMVEESIRTIYHNDINNYPKQVAFISFNPALEEDVIIKENVVEANLIRPGIWDKAINLAMKYLKPSSLGTLVFGSALNLFLFNDQYKKTMATLIKDVLAHHRGYTPLFTVSNNVFPTDIKLWEDAADNLMVTDLDDQKVLTLKIKRMKQIPYATDDTIIPIDANTLSEIEQIARSTRNKNIQAIRELK